MLSKDSLSSLLGWWSFASWLLVYSPQLYENYVLQSGEGVSVYFVLIWLVGDLANLFGAWAQHLIPTIIILAVYYTLCEIVLLTQIYYYRYRKSNYSLIPSDPSGEPGLNAVEPDDRPQTPTEEAEDHTASHTVDDRSLPTSRGKVPVGAGKSALRLQLEKALKHLTTAPVSYLTAYILIFVIGTLGWAGTNHHSQGGVDGHGPGDGHQKPVEVWNTTAQILGWVSATAYIGSRFPQILKNRETKCEGFSLLFVLVGVTGNVAYTASILTSRHDIVHIWINLSWLVGGSATVLLDLILLYQFWYYRNDRAGSCPSLQ